MFTVTDMDGDFVKCRLAVDNNTITRRNECLGICGSLAGIEINMVISSILTPIITLHFNTCSHSKLVKYNMIT